MNSTITLRPTATQQQSPLPVTTMSSEAMQLAELQERVIELWPEFARRECELGPLCYQLVKKSGIQARGKKGLGVTAWCKRAGIDRNRFNYVVQKFTPEDQKKPK